MAIRDRGIGWARNHLMNMDRGCDAIGGDLGEIWRRKLGFTGGRRASQRARCIVQAPRTAPTRGWWTLCECDFSWMLLLRCGGRGHGERRPSNSASPSGNAGPDTPERNSSHSRVVDAIRRCAFRRGADQIPGGRQDSGSAVARALGSPQPAGVRGAVVHVGWVASSCPGCDPNECIPFHARLPPSKVDERRALMSFSDRRGDRDRRRQVAFRSDEGVTWSRRSAVAVSVALHSHAALAAAVRVVTVLHTIRS